MNRYQRMKTNQTKKNRNIKYIIGGILVFNGMYASVFWFNICLFKFSKIAAGSDINTIFKIGIIICLSILISSVFASIIRDYLYKLRGRIIIHNSRKTWRITWIIGGLLSILAWIVNHHIFFVNWYFLGVGLIPLFNSFFKYAEINKEGLTIFHGIFFNRKNIFFGWSRISDIGMETIKKVGSISGGGRIWVTVKDEYEDDVFKIVLKEPLTANERILLLKDDKHNIFVDEYSINEKGDEIILNTEPEGGFAGLLNLVSKFEHFGNEYTYEQRGVSYYFLETFSVLIFFALIIMQVFVFFISFPK